MGLPVVCTRHSGIPEGILMTVPAGMIRRGKYTFDTRLVLPIRLLLAYESALEKNCQGNIAANTRIG